MIRRELLLNVLLAVGSLLVLAIAGELALRVAGYDPMGEFLDRRMGIDSLVVLRPSESPELRYELTPGARGFAFQAEIATNPHGFRDRPWSPAERDAYRIVVLGDSITFGNYMRAEDRFSDLLQGSLAAELARPTEVMNLGVVGYDTLQEVVTLERRGLSLSPDLVVLAFCVNDLGVVSFNERYLHDAPLVGSPLYRLRLAQFLRNKLDTLELVIRFKTSNEERQFAADNARYIAPVDGDEKLMALVGELERQVEAEEGSGWLGRDDSPVVDWYLSKARLGKLDYTFARLARLQERHGFDVAVLLVPYLEPTPSYDVIYRMLEHEVSKHGFELISLEREFGSYGFDRLRFAERPGDKIHPNEAGHRLIAERLLDFVAPAPQRVTRSLERMAPEVHAATVDPLLEAANPARPADVAAPPSP
jgi:lysophospholipase L1-like esterase